MLRNNKKKAFTIVELVIVIAVVAILAAVLIPTFAGLIDKANESSDIQLVKNINTALTAATIAEGKSTPPNKVVAALEKAGYNIGNLNPTAEGNYFVWDSKSNQMLYVDGEDTSKPLFTTKPESECGTVNDWWLPISDYNDIPEAFNNFVITENAVLSETLTFNKPVGLVVSSNKTLSGNVTIETEDAGTITLDGNIVGTVTIDAPNADLVQYGDTKTLNIIRIANNSAHVNGFVWNLIHKAGRLVIENEGYVYWFNEIASSTDDVTVEIKGFIDTLAEISGNAEFESNGGSVKTLPDGIEEIEGVHTGLPTNAWSIKNIDDLFRFRDAVNSGYGFAGITVSLDADLDLSGMNWNVPIGTAITYEPDDNTLSFTSGNPFKGTFEGNGHTIKGLTMVDVSVGGYGGGLFGYCYGAEIQNLNLTNVHIDSEVSCSPVASFMFWDCKVENVYVSGTSKGNWSAGIASYAQYGLLVENCNIDMDFTMSNYGQYNYIRVGGVVGQYNYDWTDNEHSDSLTVSDTDVSGCTFTVSAETKVCTVFAGGYVAQLTGGKPTIEYKGVTYNFTKTNEYGDCDPALLGITLTKAGNEANIGAYTFNLTALPTE